MTKIDDGLMDSHVTEAGMLTNWSIHIALRCQVLMSVRISEGQTAR